MVQSSADHGVQLLECGAAFFPTLLEAIGQSQTEIRLETYIFEFDSQGEQVAAALVAAADRGVRVYLMMDGIGTLPVPPDWQRRFTESGVRWHRFAPLGRFGLLIPTRWRRLHRKLCVVDAEVAVCGGINIIDDFLDPTFGILDRPRFDFSVRVTGALVADILAVMVKFWRRLQLTRQLEQLEFRHARAAWEDQGDSLLRSMDQIDSRRTQSTAGVRAALVLRDNLRNRTRIERTYRKAIANARHEVLIANAYFLPGGKLRRALVHAARRGVRVRLLLQGRYEYFMQYHAAKPVILALLNAGVEIHEYRSGFLHAKVAVIDNVWATVGSSNLDPLSLLLAREANIVLEDAVFAQQLRDRLQIAMEQDSVALDVQRYSARPWLQHALDWLAYGSMRLLLFLTGSRY